MVKLYDYDLVCNMSDVAKIVSVMYSTLVNIEEMLSKFENAFKVWKNYGYYIIQLSIT